MNIFLHFGWLLIAAVSGMLVCLQVGFHAVRRGAYFLHHIATNQTRIRRSDTRRCTLHLNLPFVTQSPTDLPFAPLILNLQSAIWLWSAAFLFKGTERTINQAGGPPHYESMERKEQSQQGVFHMSRSSVRFSGSQSHGSFHHDDFQNSYISHNNTHNLPESQRGHSSKLLPRYYP